MTNGHPEHAADPSMPRILGLYETHLTVADLQRSIGFYRDILKLELATVIEDRRVAFFWIDDKRMGMLGLWETGSAPLRMRLHIAFRTSLDDLLRSAAALKAHGVQPKGFNGEPLDEPVVLGWVPAVSQYFSDPDGHSIEFIHVLEDAADPGFGVKPYSQWLSRPKPSV
ncbi:MULTISPECIES: VOC family protein [unclassified Rhizobium]|jgi:lactoylglutathione lyase|uniref:VOC family protein n=1 Tax=unclassified Rhizobium TaxID=2613769 RepID=UPI00068E7BE6|nr:MULTISPECIES: VOC family protein [unclassified Rhizobium]MBN8949312.1 VOC family protein [Rhizobium tropici]OJY75117.1 MAG: glyoxalase [Rhizobium sp. 60-20]RKD70902.1 lactoylglutathione lyase [Rhizobium sp. WW_1]